MTDEELIARLRDLGFNLTDAAADRIEQLEAENRMLKTSGIIEVAAHNNRVTEYMFHWEGRVLDAEAKLAKAVQKFAALEKAASDVARRGAETGPQWTKLTIALLAARAALAEIKGESHE